MWKKLTGRLSPAALLLLTLSVALLLAGSLFLFLWRASRRDSINDAVFVCLPQGQAAQTPAKGGYDL